MVPELQTFYLSKDEPNKSCLLTLRSIILNLDKNVVETIKWGMPCFCYRKKMFCYLWIDRKTDHPYLLMVEGKYLNHPKLEQDHRARMKVFNINPNRNLPIKAIENILKKALDLYKMGVVKTGD